MDHEGQIKGRAFLLKLRFGVINQPLTKSCDLRWVGAAFDGRGASPTDWLLLRRVTKDMCSNKSNRRPRNGKSLGFDEPKISSDDNDEKYRLIIN